MSSLIRKPDLLPDILLSEFCRAFAKPFSEGFRKIACAVESNREGDLNERQIRVAQ